MCAETYPRTTFAQTEFDQIILGQTLQSGILPWISLVSSMPSPTRGGRMWGFGEFQRNNFCVEIKVRGIQRYQNNTLYADIPHIPKLHATDLWLLHQTLDRLQQKYINSKDHKKTTQYQKKKSLYAHNKLITQLQLHNKTPSLLH